MGLRYVLVTDWDGHWDNVPDEKTRYPNSMLRGATRQELIVGIPTVFVRIYKDGRPRRAWSGTVKQIWDDGSDIRFRFDLGPPIATCEQYASYKKGWHIEQVSTETELTPLTSQVSDLRPPFFNTLLSTQNWSEFEDYTYYLLRLLGIHAVYKFDRKKQRGKADGFFKFQGLAVIYDCTLEQKQREENKAQQIENYCAQLKKGSIEFDGKVRETLVVSRQY